MSNQSEDIQAAGSDTRPPMLDRTDFESWQQRIWLYFKGKDHGEYILQSIDEDPFKMGRGDRTKFKETILRVMLQEMKELRTELVMQMLDEGPVQDMAQKEDNTFQADQCYAFDSDVDEAPTAHTMFMANLSSANLVYDEAGPLYDSDTLSEVQDNDNSLDNMNEYHEEHKTQTNVQANDIVDSDAEYTSNGNIISYEQYVQDNEEQVVRSDVSSVTNDAVMMITNDIYEQDASLTAELAKYKELAEVYKKGPNLN
uniref:Integrase, catalytic region, zinc finger, CCHC-type, peptidase aspartic, catalytic n=1 Tax=Tanacetum cinerariifolium TaxID=118510 RepID=A0A6L2JVA1_TANCI|nr:integrase, catalytic region, zinc finger, CCHC-type, peptidase aspartic, catalytic [Tanacetum cinerariifolium]